MPPRNTSNTTTATVIMCRLNTRSASDWGASRKENMPHGLTSEKRCLRSCCSGGKKSTTGGGGGHLLGIRPKRNDFWPKTCCQFPLYPTSKGLLHTFHAKPSTQTHNPNRRQNGGGGRRKAGMICERQAVNSR